MNNVKRLAAFAIVASLLSLPAHAATMSSSSMMPGDAMAPDAMSSDAMAPMAPDAMAGGDMMMTTAKAGEVVAIMPNGQMGTAMMEGDKMSMTIGMSKALAGCVMFITGADGKTYQVDTSSSSAMAECEAVAK